MSIISYEVLGQEVSGLFKQQKKIYKGPLYINNLFNGNKEKIQKLMILTKSKTLLQRLIMK
jgi:hypothetical protein